MSRKEVRDVEVVINGKKYNLIRTLHLTECGGEMTEEGNQEASFIIYDVFNKNREYETHVLYFRGEDLESITL